VSDRHYRLQSAKPNSRACGKPASLLAVDTFGATRSVSWDSTLLLQWFRLLTRQATHEQLDTRLIGVNVMSSRPPSRLDHHSSNCDNQVAASNRTAGCARDAAVHGPCTSFLLVIDIDRFCRLRKYRVGFKLPQNKKYSIEQKRKENWPLDNT
jgi:hypothetical protein